LESRLLRVASVDGVDAKFGFDRYKEATEKCGWLINMKPVFCFSKLFLNFVS